MPMIPYIVYCPMNTIRYFIQLQKDLSVRKILQMEFNPSKCVIFYGYKQKISSQVYIRTTLTMKELNLFKYLGNGF